MAHPSFHFFVGLATGCLVCIPVILRAFSDTGPLAPVMKRWLLISYGLAFLAIAPGILRFLGASPAFCEGWWMNIFLFHPAIDKVETGGMLVGGFGIILCAGFQYGMLLFALVRAKDRPLK